MPRKICQECEEARADRADPRDPPLDIGGAVLCRACFGDAKEHREEQLQDEIAALRLSRIRTPKR